jgi:hypothetical protein
MVLESLCEAPFRCSILTRAQAIAVPKRRVTRPAPICVRANPLRGSTACEDCAAVEANER